MPISVPFIPTITSAGLTAIFNAQSTGVEFALSHIAFGTAQYTPDGTETALQAEKVRVPIAGGGPISPTQIQIYAVAMAAAGDPFFVGEVGFFGDNGTTLLAVYSSTSPPTLFLSDTVSTSVSYALGLAALPANSVTVTIDPSASAALLILGQHVASADPHPQYVQKVNGAAFYDATVTFVEDAFVVGDDGLVYQSLQNANIGHVPSTSPTWWGPVSVPAATANKHAVQLQQAQTMRGQLQSVSTLDASASVGAGAMAGAVLYYFGNTPNQTVTLPPRASVINITDRSITQFVNTSSVPVTIAPTGGEQIGGGTGESLTSIVLAPGDDLQLLAASEFSAWAAIGGSALRQFNPLVVANAISAQDAVAAAQLQSGALTYAVASGTANALTVNLTPAVTAYTDGMVIRARVVGANTSGGVTLNVNGLGATFVQGMDNQPLTAGTLVANGYAHFEYSVTAAAFILRGCFGAPQQIAPGVLPSHAVQLGQLAPSNNTGAASDVSLAVGESVYIDISAATTAPLHVTCGDNQSYEIQLQLLGNTGGAALATLAPNNSSYTNFFTWEQLFNTGTTPTSNQGYANGLVFAGSDIRYAKSFVSTKTTSKTMNTWAACALSSTAMTTNFIVSTWQATASNGGAGDTTTVWTSLGTINFPIASTGRIIVRRVS